MREAVICAPTRTAVGRFGGMFREVSVQQLASTVISAVMDRSGLEPERVDDVILGQGYPNGEAPSLGRVAALDSGLPITVPGIQLDRRCGSGLQAVLDAAMRVQTGVADVVLAGGAESMSQAEHYVLGARWGLSGGGQLLDRLSRGRVSAGGKDYPTPGGMIETAENLRAEYGISRQAQDDFAYQSQQRAGAAMAEGRFAAEIVAVETTERTGTVSVLDTDEHPRPDVSREKLGSLPPIRREQDPDATVTAGNASGQNDGAAVCIVASLETADVLGLDPVARLVSWAVAGVGPQRMGVGPVPASAAALGRAGLELRDMDLIELNEAFAAQVLAVLAEWHLASDDERLNPLGSGISLGHPIGATGARILATLLHELQRRQGRYGLETMCIGGGQGLAAVFERLA